MKIKKLLIVSQQDPGHMTGGQGVVLRSIAIEAAKLLKAPVDYLSMRIKGEPEYQEYEGGAIRVRRISVSDSDEITTPYAGDERIQFSRRMEFGPPVVEYIRTNYSPKDTAVHLNGFYAVPLLARDLPEYPAISFYHLFLSKRLGATGEGDPFRETLVRYEQDSIRANRLIHACSTGIGEEIVALMPKGEQAQTRRKLRIIPNAADDDFFDTPVVAETVPNRVVSWGRIAPEKGFEYLMEAISDLPQAQLLLFGRVDDVERRRGEYRRKLEQLANENSQIKLDFRPDGVRGAERMALIDSAQVIVVPSNYEPFGTVVLEAFSRGKPVITTDTAGGRYCMNQDNPGWTPYGYLARLKPEGVDPSEISKALKVLLNDRERWLSCSEEARKRAQLFRWSKITKELLNYLEEEAAG